MKQKTYLLLFTFLISLLVFACSQNDNSNQSTLTDENLLSVSGNQIVNQKGDTVVLRGFGLGGMLHMEHFINGYSANEQLMRESLLEVLGEKKYNLYFKTFLENYFTEADAKYINSLGLNLIRIPINYRQFEDDMNPGVIKEEGFKHLDRVIDLCAKYQIYTIIDMHALPGFQNQHWHSDNPTHVSLFWTYKDFQDRTLNLWEVIANRYKNNVWVAGYDLINEPAKTNGKSVFKYYKRLYNAVRKIDPNHIMFLEGNTYAKDFSTFTEVWDNVVYTNHDYARPGFGGDYPGTIDGKYYDKAAMEKEFLGKGEFMLKNNVPIWVGEFGPLYTGDPKIDEVRYQVLKDQLAYFKKYNASWCIWLYKDMGLHAIMHQKDDTPYMKLVSDFLVRKNYFGADAWGSTDENIRDIMAPIEDLMAREFPNYIPYPSGQKRHIRELVRHILIAEALVPEYANLFKDSSEEEIVALAKSFNFENYVTRKRLEDILTGKEQ